MEMKELVRDYLEGRLSRRGFFRRLVAAGVTTAAATSLLEAADRGELEEAAQAAGQRSEAGPAAGQRLVELTMPLDHQYSPDQYMPTATPFILAPSGDPNKGFQLGTESGTCLTLPSQ